LYKINFSGTLKTLVIRGTFLSKKFLKTNKKSTLVYLRSPKHFNIGKHKVFSFKNSFSTLLSLNLKIANKALVNYPLFFFKFVPAIVDVNTLKRINSVRISVATKVR
jgi:hypothetical protein